MRTQFYGVVVVDRVSEDGKYTYFSAVDLETVKPFTFSMEGTINAETIDKSPLNWLLSDCVFRQGSTSKGAWFDLRVGHLAVVDGKGRVRENSVAQGQGSDGAQS